MVKNINLTKTELKQVSMIKKKLERNEKTKERFLKEFEKNQMILQKKLSKIYTY